MCANTCASHNTLIIINLLQILSRKNILLSKKNELVIGPKLYVAK